MATNRLPVASRKHRDKSTINLEVGARSQAACGSTLTLLRNPAIQSTETMNIMINTQKFRNLLLMASAMLLVSFTSVGAADGAAYAASDLTFKEVKSQADGTVQIVFTSLPETLYYCPGAKATTTKKGVELTFVRSRIKKKPKVDYPAKLFKKGEILKVVTVPAKGNPVFLRDGKKLVKLHPADAKK